MTQLDSGTFATGMEIPAANIVDLSQSPVAPVRSTEWPRTPGRRYMQETLVQEDEPASFGEALLDGAVAGLIGGAAMMLLRPLAERTFLREGDEAESEWEHFVRTKAEDAGRHPSDGTVRAAGAGAHLGYAALWGALYGPAQRALDLPHLMHGLLFGGAVYAANFPKWGLMPALGVLPPTKKQDRRYAAIPVTTHIIFGIGTALAYSWLSRRRNGI